MMTKTQRSLGTLWRKGSFYGEKAEEEEIMGFEDITK